MSENTSTITRRQLGRYLREAREAAHLTLIEAADALEWGKSTLQRLEVGQTNKIRMHDLNLMIELYEIEDLRAAALKGLAQQAAEKSWWHEFGSVMPEDFRIYIDMESAASALTTYQPDLVPGLLQTPAYARVLARAARPGDSDTQIADRLELKARRQRRITRALNPTRLDIVLGETALRRVVGTETLMADQLKRLADASTLPHVTLRVLPFSAGMPTGDQIGPFVIIDFKLDSRGEPTQPSTVYSEGYSSDMYSEKRDVVERYQQAYQRIQHASLDETSSRKLLRDIAREFSA